MARSRPSGDGDGGERDLTLSEAAERLGVHYMTAYRYVRTGRMPATKSGGEWRVSRVDVDRMAESAEAGSPAPVRRGSPDVRGRFLARLEDRMVAGDEAGAWSVVESAQAAGAGADELYLDLLAPALAAIGDRWEAGLLGVDGEHRATSVAMRLIGRLGPRFARRGRKRGTVVVGAPSGERHSIPIAMVADLLRGAGFEVLDLGADCPPASFADTVRASADGGGLVAVLVSVTMAEHLPAAAACAVAVRDALPGPDPTVEVLVGGAAMRDEEAARVAGAAAITGGTGIGGASAADALAAVERVVAATGSG